MKKITGLFLLMFATIFLQAQNYFIDFTACGVKTSLDSVLVENLTQGTSLTLQGSDTLLLFGTVGIPTHLENSSDLKIYPNPMRETSNIEFFSEIPALAEVEIFDVTGKLLAHTRQQIEQGISVFEITGFASGSYTLNVSTSTWQKAVNFISVGSTKATPQIKFKSTSHCEPQLKKTTAKSIKNVVQMSYTTGETMQFTGYSGVTIDVVTDVPSTSKTIDFVFTVPAQPSTIIPGTDTIICSGVGQTYTVTNVPGITYTWTYTGTGWNQTAGGTTNSITASATSSGTLTVTPSNSCGNGTAQTLVVTTTDIPAQPSIISGATTSCQGATGLTYSVTNVGGVTYTWTVPTGWSITAGQGNNSITVTAGTASGNISVTPSNACGNGTARTLAVTTATAPTLPTAGTHTPSATQIIWNWSSVSGATGYKVNVTNNYATAIDLGNSTSATETSLTCNTPYTRYVWAYNACGQSSVRILNASTSVCPFVCGTSTVTFTYKGSNVTYGTVSGTGSKCWLDRNLGALQVATSQTDANAYGDLFQWGRGDDGHQIRTSGTTNFLASTDHPGHPNFILPSSSPNDWRSNNNNNRWNATPMVNNPCPSGWRVPTDAEWNTERQSWTNNNATGAFNSPLKLTMAGRRDRNSGVIDNTNGNYWSRTVIGTDSRNLHFHSSNAIMFNNNRAFGYSVRCIKDD